MFKKCVILEIDEMDEKFEENIEIILYNPNEMGNFKMKFIRCDTALISNFR